MKNSFSLTLLLATGLVIAMENPEIIVAPEQQISLLQSFLLATDFKVTQHNMVTYPHYTNTAQLFSQPRPDAILLLWQAHGNGIEDKEQDLKSTRLCMQLYENLDRDEPLLPQITQDNRLLLQTYLFRRFFAHKDLDKNDDILITRQGIIPLATAQQKHIMGEFRKSLLKVFYYNYLPQIK